MKNPYESLPPEAFWKPCLDSGDKHLNQLYKPKKPLLPESKVATAGSCFAQYFRSRLIESNLSFVDVEPKPDLMSYDVGRGFGYGIYSARFGNIYTTRQLRQLVEDCTTLAVHEGAIWEQEGRWFDGLRPGIEPQGFVDRNAVLLHRRSHLRRVREMFRKANLFVFTLGLTEAWQDIGTGIVFPTVPGTVAGTFDSAQHAFVNFGVLDVISDLEAIIDCVKTLNRGIQFLFTVSPVSLVATASGFHVSQATAYSKSVLRTAAGEVVRKTACADYFPSYEIITSPMFRSQFLAPNCRAVTPEGVDTVMAAFFAAYPDLVAQSSENVVRPDFTTPEPEDDDLMCEEILLQGFAAS